MERGWMDMVDHVGTATVHLEERGPRGKATVGTSMAAAGVRSWLSRLQDIPRTVPVQRIRPPREFAGLALIASAFIGDDAIDGPRVSPDPVPGRAR